MVILFSEMFFGGKVHKNEIKFKSFCAGSRTQKNVINVCQIFLIQSLKHICWLLAKSFFVVHVVQKKKTQII